MLYHQHPVNMDDIVNNEVPLYPPIVAVVPAAGMGMRMGSALPKQYMYLGNRTLLEHSVALLLKHSAVRRIIIVTHEKDEKFTTLPLASDPKIKRVFGGKWRANSVLSGIEEASEAEWILVHDAVRPCLMSYDLERLLMLSITSQIGGLLAVPVTDTIKRVEKGSKTVVNTLHRQGLWRALTPQLFPRPLLYNCLLECLNIIENITDESSALEHCGYNPQLLMGDPYNIKVTYPNDILFAKFFLFYGDRLRVSKMPEICK